MTPLHSTTASFGGIFGLCLGGSIISLVEILYFLFGRLLFGTEFTAMEQPKNPPNLRVRNAKFALNLQLRQTRKLNDNLKYLEAYHM